MGKEENVYFFAEIKYGLSEMKGTGRLFQTEEYCSGKLFCEHG